MEPVDRKKLIDTCVALQKVPRVYAKLKLFWGFPEFLEYVDDLLTMESGREERRGFDDEIHAELTLLKDEFVNHPEDIMDRNLTQSDKDKLQKLIEKTTHRTRYL